MSRLTTEAILLRAVDFGESDRIVHLLTPDRGRIAAIGKGARRSAKRFPGTLDLFNHLSVQLDDRPRKGLAYLERAILISPFPELRTSTARFGLACHLVELVDRLVHEGGSARDMRDLFDFVRETLLALESSVPDTRLRVLLELRILDALGLRPELRNCVRCGDEVRASGQVGFHVGDGGVVCVRCRRDPEGLIGVALGTLRVLEQALAFDASSLGRLRLASTALDEAEHLIHRFQRFHVGIELRSSRFLDEVLRGTQIAAERATR